MWPWNGHIVVMMVINVAKLKQRLGQYLAKVQRGEEVVILSHQRRVARLIPDSGAVPGMRRPLRPMGDLVAIRGTKVSGVRAVASLLADRRAR